MKPIFQTAFGLFVFAILGLASASAQRVDDALIDELTGLVPNPERELGELGKLYLEAFASLTTRIDSKIEIDRTQTQGQLKQMFDHVGRPGNEAQAKVLFAAVGKQLEDKAYPQSARHILIRGLGRVGSAECVPALASLMASSDAIEKDLARMSLQQVPGEEAANALLEALKNAAGDSTTTLGLLDSIAARKPTGSAKAIAPLLSSDKPEIAAATATALGRVGGGSATQALGGARSGTADEKVRTNIDRALLDIANQRGLAGDREGAGKIFKLLGEQTSNQAVRTAAMYGLARSQPQLADAIIIAAVKSKDMRLRSTGISASIMVANRRLSKGLAAMLETEPKQIQLQILSALAAKGDISVQENVVKFLNTIEGKDKDLELAALRALGPLGSVQTVELLLEKAVSDVPSIRETAKASLAQIKGKDIAQTIEFHARQGKTSDIRSIAVGLFMRNRDNTGLTRMMDFAAEKDAKVSSTAISVLRQQAGDGQFRGLLDLMGAGELEILPVITAVCGRAENPDLLTGEIITFLRGTENPRYQRFLMSCLPILGSSRGLPVLLENIGDGKKASDPALRALSRWPDANALPEMLKLLKSRNDDRVSVGLMVKGISRLIDESGDELSLENRVSYLTEAFEVSPGARERLMLLPVMAKLPHEKIAGIVEDMLKDRYVAAIAANTAAALCEQLVETDPEAAKSLALGLTKGKFNSIIRGRGQAVLNTLAGPKKEL